jgi:peptide deformylase
MAVRKILLLGNPKLHQICDPVEADELDHMGEVVIDLHDTLMDCQRRIRAGRAIAAPQIGVMKRLVYMHIDRPVVFLNPRLDHMSEASIELWDDCLSFPDLLVRVRRHQRCRLRYRDMDWIEQEVSLEGDLAELLQHECDHLDGVLAVARAIDGQSFMLRSQRNRKT